MLALTSHDPRITTRARGGTPPSGALSRTPVDGSLMVDPSIWRQLAPAMAQVGTMTGLVLGGVLLGLWLDHRFGTAPVLVGVCAFAGLVAGARQLARGIPNEPPHDPPPPPTPPPPP
ncbi:MAG: AtpZ/AtpI family protein [Myxococcales bacterium]|nr:AtpZ/AtpI family protein [Myxococcales bacterium]